MLDEIAEAGRADGLGTVAAEEASLAEWGNHEGRYDCATESHGKLSLTT